MGSITENLKKILTAVYGKDVRQAIYDSIKQCETDANSAVANANSALNKAAKALDTATDAVETMNSAISTVDAAEEAAAMVLAVATETMNLAINDFKLWYLRDDNIVELINADTSAANTNATEVAVSPGERYLIHTRTYDYYSTYYHPPIMMTSEKCLEAGGIMYRIFVKHHCLREETNIW